MRNKLISILFTLCSIFGLAAEERSERVYLSTERQIYIAGETVHCSAYCLDADGQLSDFSMTAYLELHSAAGMVTNGRAALNKGRGCAAIELSRSLPSGNYRLVAYTRIGLMRDNCNPAAGSKLITVINPYGSERVEGGVEIVDARSYSELRETRPAASGSVSAVLSGPAKAGSVVSVDVRNSGDTDANVDISIVRCDDMKGPGNSGMAGFLAADASCPALSGNLIPDYEGEVINARVAGIPESDIGLMEGQIAFISAAGDKSDIYSSTIGADGRVDFYTSNIFGNKDLICELEKKLDGMPAHLEIISPFVDVQTGDIPELSLCESLRNDILARSVSAQLSEGFGSETISDFLEIRPNLLYNGECRSYKLDDYTRFPTMHEIMTEFIPELRVRKEDGKQHVNVLVTDSYKRPSFSQGTALMMIDGVPVFDHEQLLNYDPLLVERVDIYTSRFYIGARYYDGIVSFTTYGRNLPSMKFTPDVRVYSFKGAAMPGILNGMGIDAANEPDYRQTAFWHPLISLKSGADESYEFRIPNVPGRYIVKIEGIDSKGKPIFADEVITINQ